MSVDIATYVHDLAVAAKAASASLATASDEQRQEAVRAMAAALRNGVDSIVAANELDMSAARDAGTSAGLLDRLLLTPERVEGMAAGLEKLAELPDPVGRVLDHRVLSSGVDLTRVSVPLGLVAMVYEARPNVTADAAGICIRTGNACILRGGSLAYHSCAMIAELLADALETKGFPARGRVDDRVHRPRGHWRAHEAPRYCRRTHSARRRRPDPALRARVACAGDRDGHGQLPHLRA